MRIATPYIQYKPKKLKDLTWRIIVSAWESGASDKEVSLLLIKEGKKADQLSATEVHQLYAKNKDICELKEMLNYDLINAARLSIAKSVKKGDVKSAKWYLERKAADEFSTKQAVAFEGAVIELSIEDKEKALKEMVDKYKTEK